jgi:hypothetical protein
MLDPDLHAEKLAIAAQPTQAPLGSYKINSCLSTFVCVDYSFFFYFFLAFWITIHFPLIVTSAGSV